MSLNVSFLHDNFLSRQTSTDPVTIIRARAIAHSEFEPFELALMAAEWVDNRAIVIPTTELAGQVFGVSRQLICQERRRRPSALLPLGLLARGWINSSSDERAAFAREFEPEIWSALEFVTDQH